MSEFESKSTEHCCKNCKWCDISNTIAICRKFKKAVSFARTTCLEDEERWKSEEIAEKDLYKLSDNLIDEMRKYADNPPLISLNHKLGLLEAKYEAVEAYIPKLEEKDKALTDRVAKIEKRFEANDTEFAKVFKEGFFEWEKDIQKRLEALEAQAKHFGNYIPSSPYELKISTTDNQVANSKTETTTKKCGDVNPEDFKCRKCHSSFAKLYERYISGSINYCPNCGAKVEEEE